MLEELLLSHEYRGGELDVLFLGFTRREDLIDQTVIDRLLRSENLVALNVLTDIFDRS